MTTRRTSRTLVSGLWNLSPRERLKNPLFWVLLPLSWAYGGAVVLRNHCYDRGWKTPQRLPCVVISVGNLTVGGTGKTPMVIFLASLLKKRGHRPAILSRGYRGKAGEEDRRPVHLVSDGESIFMSAADAGDEPLLMAETLPGVPVLTGSRRFLAGQWARNHLDADCLILDDGYQHRQLDRDVDILLIQNDQPFGNGLLLPAGPLRESIRGRKRAHAVIRTGQLPPPASLLKTPKPAEAYSSLADRFPGNIPVFTAHREASGVRKGFRGAWEPLTTLSGKEVCAFAGIASPPALKKTLEAAGVRVVCFIAFPDHHSYGKADILHLENTFRPFGIPVVTTEKDAVKLRDYASFAEGLVVLRVEMIVEPPGAFEAWLLQTIQERKENRRLPTR